VTFFGGVCVALTRRRVPEQHNILLWFFKFEKKKKKTRSKLRGMLFHAAQSILSSSGVAVLFFGGAGRRSRGKP
jgi:hypothetical protein